METLFMIIYVFGGVGIFCMVLGTRSLVYPQDSPFKTRYFILFFISGLVTGILILNHHVSHLLDTRNAVYSLLFAVSFVISFSLPVIYSIILLQNLGPHIPPQRRIWIKRLRLGFIVSVIYPLLEAISGFEPFLIFDIFAHFILVISSALFLLALPDLKEWFFDELKTLTALNALQTNPLQKISIIWDKVEDWQKAKDLEELSIKKQEIHSYIKQILAIVNE